MQIIQDLPRYVENVNIIHHGSSNSSICVEMRYGMFQRRSHDMLGVFRTCESQENSLRTSDLREAIRFQFNQGKTNFLAKCSQTADP